MAVGVLFAAMDLLDNPIRAYAWGSHTAIAEMQGRAAPTPEPEAEVWMGAHRSGPSYIVRGGTRRSLLDEVREAPAISLGESVIARFGPIVPFMMKILAAEQPLSLQAHPTRAQAKSGFDDEDRRGVALDAPQRNYKDKNHKPELLCALTTFEALCGFRDPRETARLFAWLGDATLGEYAGDLANEPRDATIRAVFSSLMTLPRTRHAALVTRVLKACRAKLEARGVGQGDAAPGGAAQGDASRESRAFDASVRWAVALGEKYPGDVGVVTSLMLNYVKLEPGEALFLPAGNLHAYLRGVAVEVMACSDNVLRGGLTAKHVDVDELLRVLVFRGGPVEVLRARARAAGEQVYETPAEEFELSRVDVGGERAREMRVAGPEVIAVCDGAVAASDERGVEIALARGAAAFVAAATGRYELRGRGTVYRVTVPRARANAGG